MRYYCVHCQKYWANTETRYTLWDPPRDCPECLAKRGYRWVDAGACWKVKIEKGAEE